jgi:hypothetical protein
MSKWEDILKDKLEGYESPLPEGGLAEFRARRAGSAPAAKRYSPRWGWALAGAAAVAAGLAALLLPPRPTVPEDAIQVIKNQPVVETMASDSADIIEPVPVLTPLVQPVSPTSTRRVAAVLPKTESVSDTPEEDAAEPAAIELTEASTVPQAEKTEAADAPVDKNPVPDETRWTESPFVPQTHQARKIRLDVAPVAGAVASGGLLAAVLTPWARGGKQDPTSASSLESLSINNSGPVNNGYVYYNYFTNSVADNPYSPESNNLDAASIELDLKDVPENATHYRPLKTGLSARIPLTEKLSLTSGLTYSLYGSKFTYTLSGEKTQLVHYLGIPVRLDYTLASNRWLDVYVGGGVAGDLCVGSTLGGNAFAKDGPGFSVLGAGGLQWNMTKRLGLYVEPELSWTLPSEKHILKTYRNEHPLVFTVATGLRINLNLP